MALAKKIDRKVKKKKIKNNGTKMTEEGTKTEFYHKKAGNAAGM